jgi:hypothetical protein
MDLFFNRDGNVGVLVFIVKLVEAVGEVNRLVFAWFVLGFNEGVDLFAFEVSNSVTALNKSDS